MPWRLLLRRAFRLGVVKGAQLLIKALRGDRLPDAQAVSELYESWEQTARESVRNIAARELPRNFPDEPNPAPFLALLQEREANIAQAIRGHRFLFEQSAVNGLNIGRRGQDIVRELALAEFEKAATGFNTRVPLARELFNKIQRRGIEVAADISQDEIFEFYRDFQENVPVFKTKDGKLKFWLQDRNGKYRAFDAEYYADLVAITTVDEASETATDERTLKLGYKHIVFNRLGKNYETDPKCKAIDGQIFAIVREEQEGGRWGARGASGKFYQHVENVLGSEFKKAHPFCNHTRSPMPFSRT